MSLLALLLLAQTEPPMVPADAPPLAPVSVRRRVREPDPPVRMAIHFNPLSLFGVDFAVEADVHLANGISVFGAANVGAFGQVGGDAGLRWYVLGSPFEGFFIDAHGSIFGMFNDPLLMAGGGSTIGHSWRKGHFVISIGVGFTTFASIRPAAVGIVILGGAVSQTDIPVLPGLMEPPGDRGGVQPTLRFTIGPAF